MTHPQVGSLFAGYRIESIAGGGGMGLYKAFDAHLKRWVALKVLAPQLAEDPGFRERFARESPAAAAIDHQNVTPIYGDGEHDGELFIAMRWVEGTDLRTLIDREGRLPPERAAATAPTGLASCSPRSSFSAIVTIRGRPLTAERRSRRTGRCSKKTTRAP